MSRRYTTEQKAWLNAYIPGHHHADTAEAFMVKWPDTPMSSIQVKAYSNYRHIPCGRKNDKHRSKYSKEVRDFISANVKDRSEAELHQMICQTFGPVMTPSQLHAYKKNHHLRSGLSGCFQKGHTPKNKGKTWNGFMPKESQERARQGCFKKGHVPHNQLRVGTVVQTTDGYLARKIAEPHDWEYVHRATWKKYHGPIPDGMCVTFKDGNTENCDIDNLMLVSRAEHLRMNQSHLRYEEPELTETGLIIAKVMTAAGERRRKKHDRSNPKRNHGR